MRKTKLAISLLLVVVMVAASVVALVACDKEDDRIELLVWAPSAAQNFYKEWADKWAKDYKDSQGRQFKIKLGIQGEGEAATEITRAPADSADVFAFADDQLGTLVTAGILSEVGDPAQSNYAKDIAERNSAGSVQAASYNGKLYAYPMQADNGYFLYYDSSVLSEEDITNWDKLWAKVEEINAEAAQRKQVLFAYGTAWYQASWFFTFGGQVSQSATNFNTDEVGLKALQAAHDFSDHQDLYAADPNDGVPGLQNGDIVAAVSGGWIYSDVITENPNIKVTTLPAVVYEGVEYPMYTFLGSKLFGVNGQRSYQEASHALANYLTSEEVQIAKAAALAAGPSNIVAAESDAAASLPTLQALAKQSEWSVPQINLPAGFWDALPIAINAVQADPTNEDLATYYPGGQPDLAKLRELLADLLTNLKLAA